MRINDAILAYEMRRRDLRQIQLSEISGVSRATISYIMCGKRCSSETAQKIAEALGVSVEHLRGGVVDDASGRN